MAPEDESPIVQWYNGRSIFITGGTGFMGKVLVEKLLYSCKNVQCLYLLMRNKRGRTPEQRVEDIWKLPMFERLRKSQPDAKQKIKVVLGDVNTEKLGISQSDEELIINNASVIFHVAATLKLEAKLKDAIEQNTAGTARVIELAKKIKDLKVFVHYSTAFCSADLDVFEEKVYDCKDNPHDVMEVAKWMDSDILDKVTPHIIAPHPNTYTYSKRLAESLVAEEAKNLNVCIIRPSIVTPSWSEPLPGWVDSLNGPMGLLVGAGKGVIRSMHCNGENRAHVIPCDAAICASLVIAQRVGSLKEKPKEIPVYNLTQDEVIRIKYREVLDRGRSIAYEYPFEMQIWYPDGDIRSSKWVHYLFCIFLHWLPAYFIDLLMFIFRQKTFMVRIQRKIHDGLELLQFFTTREWFFKSDNFLGLTKTMTEADNKVFPMDFTVLTVEEYLKICILGARQYCMKEDLSSLPRCRRQQKVLYVVHKLLVFTFYYTLFCMIISWSSTAKSMFNYVGSYVQNVPIIGHLVHFD